MNEYQKKNRENMEVFRAKMKQENGTKQSSWESEHHYWELWEFGNHQYLFQIYKDEFGIEIWTQPDNLKNISSAVDLIKPD